MRILLVFGAIACLGCSDFPGRSKVQARDIDISYEKEEPTEIEVLPPTVDVQEVEKTTLHIPEKYRTRAAAILIARIAINENTKPLRSELQKGSAGKPTSDHRAMLQEMLMFSQWKNVSLKRAAKWQSKYVTGVKESKPGHQHAWTSTLPARGKSRPSGWVECPRKRPKGFKCHGNWKSYADNWATFREWVVAQVIGGEIEAECKGKPITWGGDMDDNIAIARGLCVIEGCGDKNTWWTFPGWGCDEPLKKLLKRTGIKKKGVPARLIIKGYRASLNSKNQ